MKFKKALIISLLVVFAAGAAFYAAFHLYFSKCDDPAEDLETALNAVKERDQETADKYIDFSSFYREDDITLYNSLMKDFTYVISDVTVDGSQAKASVMVSNRDMDEIYGNFIVDACQQVIDNAALEESERLSNEDMEAKVKSIFMEHIINDTANARSARVEMTLKRKGRIWQVYIDDSYFDDIFGGYYTAQENAEKILESLDSGSIEELEDAYGKTIETTRLNIKKAVHFMVDDIWNEALRNVVSCINAGTDADGNEYDLEDGIQKLDKLMDEKKSYDDLINGLDDEAYSKIKKTWKKAGKLLTSLYNEIKKTDSQANDEDYKPDTSKFEKYLNKLVELVY